MDRGAPSTCDHGHGARWWRAAAGLPAGWRDLEGDALGARLTEALERGTVLRRTRARRTVAVEVDGVRLVLKASVGDEPRDWWYERLRGAPLDPARREARALERARAVGLPVPRPLARWSEPVPRLVPPSPGRGSLSVLALEWVEHREHLGRALTAGGSERRRALATKVAELVARLHRSGGYHRDLYVGHLVPRAADGELVLLDLGRARFERRPRRRWWVKDLAALHGSAPPAVGPRERWRVLLTWLDRTGRPRSEARSLALAVERKSRALFGHRPVDQGTDRAGWPADAPTAPDPGRGAGARGAGAAVAGGEGRP